MMALSVRPPAGNLLLGTAPNFAWGAPSGVADVINVREGTDFRGDLLIHQSKAPGPELAMKFTAEDHGAFPRGAILGLVRVKAVLPPTEPLASPWAEDGFWHWLVCFPRAFALPIPWRGALGLFEVHSFAVKRAADDADWAAHNLFRALPEHEREELVELAAMAEDRGVPAPLANRLAINEFQQNRALRAHVASANG